MPVYRPGYSVIQAEWNRGYTPLQHKLQGRFLFVLLHQQGVGVPAKQLIRHLYTGSFAGAWNRPRPAAYI